MCKFVSIEMKSAFHETGKTKEVIDRNYNFIDSKGAPPIKYIKSWVTFTSEVTSQQTLNQQLCCLPGESQLRWFWIFLTVTLTHTHTLTHTLGSRGQELGQVSVPVETLIIEQGSCSWTEAGGGCVVTAPCRRAFNLKLKTFNVIKLSQFQLPAAGVQ